MNHIGTNKGDRYPFYISKIISNTRIVVTPMSYKILPNPNSVDGHWEMGERASYCYTKDTPRADDKILTYRSKTGRWGTLGHKPSQYWSFGFAEYYYDPHF